MLIALLSTFFFLAAVLASAVVVVGWRRRREAPGFLATALMALGTVHWSLTDAGLVLSHDPRAVYLLVLTSFPGSCLLAASWWCLSYSFTDRTWSLTRRAGLLMTIEPVLCLLAAGTDPWHHLFIRQLRVTGVEDLLAPVFGPFFWLHSTYTFGMLGVALVRLVRGWVSTSSRYQGHYFALAISLPALACNVVGLASNGRLPDLTALGFAVTSPLLYWMVSRLSIPAAAPVAHQLVFEKISDVIMVMDRKGLLLDLNPAAEKLLRRACVDLPTYLVGAELGVLLAKARKALPAGTLLTTGDGDREQTIPDVGGSGLDLHIKTSELYDRRQRSIGWVVVGRDVTEQLRQRQALEQANEQLHEQVETIEALRAGLSEQAARDHLTGLYNRRYLGTELAAAVHRGETEGCRFAVALIDIDHFKSVNDRYGHAAGDAVLVHVASMLSDAAAPSDVVARHGGEEFVVLFAEVDDADAVARTEALRERVRSRPVPVDGEVIAVTFSAGVAGFAPGRSPSDLLSAADQALYVAKRSGRDRVEVAGHPSTV